MATTERQNRLLVAEDWRKIYQSFQQADFKSYDFETLRRTMVAYLQENYPDDFNDFVESSEYVALIDLIAYIAQALSFRVDLNARERYKVSTMGQVVDHYQTLQIEQSASVEDVKQAFRTLAKRYHPDKNPGQEEAAEQMFRRITTAYQILSDEQRRMLYDLTLDQPKAEHNPYLERLRPTQVRRKRFELMFQELLNHNINEGIRINE